LIKVQYIGSKSCPGNRVHYNVNVDNELKN